MALIINPYSGGFSGWNRMRPDISDGVPELIRDVETEPTVARETKPRERLHGMRCYTCDVTIDMRSTAEDEGATWSSGDAPLCAACAAAWGVER